MTIFWIIIAICLSPVWIPIVLIAVGLCLVIAFVVGLTVWQAVGVPVTVTKNKVKVGYIRWFKFHRI